MLRDDGSWGFSDPLASGSGSNTLPAADQGLESAPASPIQSPRMGPSLGDALLHFPASSHTFTSMPFTGEMLCSWQHSETGKLVKQV